jgi:hypothetical protein
VATKHQPGTLPDHDHCIVHKTYMLGCAQFEQLIARSGQRCEVCGEAGSAGHSAGKLHIDHDHAAPRWAVRGLLCGHCNVRLTRRATAVHPAWAAGYLDNAWWRKECEHLSVPTTTAPEPYCGSVIIDQYDTTWLREGDGLWRPQGRGKPGISSADWQWLYRCRGPHNLAPIDLYASPRDWHPLRWEHLMWESERAALVALLNEPRAKKVPLYRTHAYRTLLPAFMGTDAPQYPPGIARFTA